LTEFPGRRQLPSVPSLIPSSRATCAIGLPVSRTIRTAPSLNSLSNLRRDSIAEPPRGDVSTVRGEAHTNEFSKPWIDEIVNAADVVIAMGCGDAWPIFPGKRYEEWAIDDPAGQGVDIVRPIRDDIEERVRRLLNELGVTPVA